MKVAPWKLMVIVLLGLLVVEAAEGTLFQCWMINCPRDAGCMADVVIYAECSVVCITGGTERPFECVIVP